MRKLLNRTRIAPRWLLAAAVATVVIVALVLMAAPTQAGSPIAPEATATPPATPSPTPARRILFSGCPLDQAPEPSHCHDWSIYEINSDGTGLRKLSLSRDDPPTGLALSPDGRRLLFSAKVQGPVPANDSGTELDAYKFRKAFLLDLATLKESGLQDDTAVCQWATNNQAVCRITAQDESNRGLYLVDLGTGGRQKTLTGLGAIIQAFSISPDGRQVLLSEQSLTGGYPQDAKIVATRVMVTGMGRTNLLVIPGSSNDHPSDVNWSPSGQWAVIQADARVGSASLWIGDTQGWNLKKAAELASIVNILGWSLNERDVLVHVCDRKTGERFGRIVAISRDGTGVHTVATLQGPKGVLADGCGQGRLSPDQRSLLFWFISLAMDAPLEQGRLFVSDNSLSQIKKVLSGYNIQDAIWLRP